MEAPTESTTPDETTRPGRSDSRRKVLSADEMSGARESLTTAAVRMDGLGAGRTEQVEDVSDSSSSVAAETSGYGASMETQTTGESSCRHEIITRMHCLLFGRTVSSKGAEGGREVGVVKEMSAIPGV